MYWPNNQPNGQMVNHSGLGSSGRNWNLFPRIWATFAITCSLSQNNMSDNGVPAWDTPIKHCSIFPARFRRKHFRDPYPFGWHVRTRDVLKALCRGMTRTDVVKLISLPTHIVPKKYLGSWEIVQLTEWSHVSNFQLQIFAGWDFESAVLAPGIVPMHTKHLQPQYINNGKPQESWRNSCSD